MNETSLPLGSTDRSAASIVESLRAAGSVDALRELIQQLSAGWDDLNERQKLSLIREIDRRSGDMVRRANLAVVPQEPSAPATGKPAEKNAMLSRLTWRELQTLGALTEGRSTSEIAMSFGISETTVRSHVKSILAKLGVHSRLEAVALAGQRISRRMSKRVS